MEKLQDDKFIKKFIAIISFALLFQIIAIFLVWVNQRDKDLNTWAEAYEKCVKVEYNTTPSAWYAEHGEYPTCLTD